MPSVFVRIKYLMIFFAAPPLSLVIFFPRSREQRFTLRDTSGLAMVQTHCREPTISRQGYSISCFSYSKGAATTLGLSEVPRTPYFAAIFPMKSAICNFIDRATLSYSRCAPRISQISRLPRRLGGIRLPLKTFSMDSASELVSVSSFPIRILSSTYTESFKNVPGDAALGYRHIAASFVH